MAQQVFPLGFYLASDDSHPQIQHLLDIRRGVMEQGDRATDVDAANDHVHPCSSEGPCQVNSPWILVRLYSHQTHHSFPPYSMATTNDPGNVNFMDGLVEKLASQFKILA